MIEHIAPIYTDDPNQTVPIWMLNRTIVQINHAIDQIQLSIELATPYTPTQETQQ